MKKKVITVVVSVACLALAVTVGTMSPDSIPSTGLTAHVLTAFLK